MSLSQSLTKCLEVCILINMLPILVNNNLILKHIDRI